MITKNEANIWNRFLKHASELRTIYTILHEGWEWSSLCSRLKNDNIKAGAYSPTLIKTGDNILFLLGSCPK